MSERWGDSRRDRDSLDRWITRSDDEEDECPAGGPHVPTFDSSHPDRMFDEYPHCDECGASLPKPQKEEP